MKSLLTISMLLALASCSSVPKTGDIGTDAIIAHMSKGVTIIGKPFDEKFEKDGLIDGEYIAIGKSLNFATYDMPHDIDRTKSFADGQVRLLRSAPSDFKKMLMTTISTMNGGNLEVDESSITITEVKALTGINNRHSDFQCVVSATPTQDLKYRFHRECRNIVRIPASNLEKAYKFTLNKKYGISDVDVKQSLNNNLMNKLLEGTSPQLSNVPQ